MPESFALSMVHSPAFLESALKKVELILKESTEFNKHFKVAFDIKARKMQFYSFFKMSENEQNGAVFLTSQNDCGLSKNLVEGCSSQSIFDHIKQLRIPLKSFEEIHLNHQDNILYVQDNIVME